MFDRRSTQTHLVNAHAAIALRALVEQPTDAAELAGKLAEATGLETAASRELAAEILQVFDRLGLAEPTGP